MKLLEESPTAFKFETSNGCTWTRQKLKWATKSVRIRGWEDTRDLYLPDESDAELFPDATHRLVLSPQRSQCDPLFVTVPCRIKPGKKAILQIFGHDGSVEYDVRVSVFFTWEKQV